MEKIAIVTQGISDWPDNERPLDALTGFLFQSGLIWEVWLEGVSI